MQKLLEIKNKNNKRFKKKPNENNRKSNKY